MSSNANYLISKLIRNLALQDIPQAPTRYSFDFDIEANIHTVNHFLEEEESELTVEQLAQFYPDGIECWFIPNECQLEEPNYTQEYEITIDSIYGATVRAMHCEFQRQLESTDSEEWKQVINDKFSRQLKSLYRKYQDILEQNQIAPIGEKAVFEYQKANAAQLALFSTTKEINVNLVNHWNAEIAFHEQSIAVQPVMIDEDRLSNPEVAEAIMAANHANQRFKRDLMTVTERDDDYEVHFYNRHNLFLPEQVDRLPEFSSVEESNYLSTGTAHGTEYTLANSARAEHAILSDDEYQIISHINRHGSPSPNEIYAMVKDSNGYERHMATVYTCENMLQHLLNCQLDKLIKMVPDLEVSTARELATTLFTLVRDSLDGDVIGSVSELLNSHDIELEIDEIEELITIKNIHNHLITATGVAGTAQQQFLHARDARIAQYTTQNGLQGYYYMVNGVNSMRSTPSWDGKKILKGNNCVQFIELYKTLSLKSEACIYTDVIERNDEINLLLTQYEEALQQTREAAKTYIDTVKQGEEPYDVQQWNVMRKQFKSREKNLHAFAEELSLKIHEVIKDYSLDDDFINECPKDAAAWQSFKVANHLFHTKVWAQVGVNLIPSEVYRWEQDKYNGLMQSLIQSGFQSVMSVSFGCKSANDRALLVALLCNEIDLCLHDGMTMEQIFVDYENLYDRAMVKYTTHISSYHTRLDHSSFPKTGKDILSQVDSETVKLFKDLKSLAAHKRIDKSKISQKELTETLVNELGTLVDEECLSEQYFFERLTRWQTMYSKLIFGSPFLREMRQSLMVNVNAILCRSVEWKMHRVANCIDDCHTLYESEKKEYGLSAKRDYKYLAARLITLKFILLLEKQPELQVTIVAVFQAILEDQRLSSLHEKIDYEEDDTVSIAACLTKLVEAGTAKNTDFLASKNVLAITARFMTNTHRSDHNKAIYETLAVLNGCMDLEACSDFLNEIVELLNHEQQLQLI